MSWAQECWEKVQQAFSAAFYFSSLFSAASSAAVYQNFVLFELNNFVAVEPIAMEEHCNKEEYITTIKFHEESIKTSFNTILDAEASCHRYNIDGTGLANCDKGLLTRA